MPVPNTALTWRRVQIPTVNEILQQMEGATTFFEVDLSQGYLQLTLAEESPLITAFSTPDDGPHRFTHLIMGASPSREHFHEIIHNLIREIPGTANISDNIWIWSRDKNTRLQQLDQLLTKLLNWQTVASLSNCLNALSLCHRSTSSDISSQPMASSPTRKNSKPSQMLLTLATHQRSNHYSASQITVRGTSKITSTLTAVNENQHLI